MRNFYLKKRMWRCLWFLKNFLVILPEKSWWKWWFGGASRRAWRSKESILLKMKKKTGKKREVREWAGQRNEKMSDCVVGSGVRWGLACGNPKQIPDLDFFVFCFYCWLGHYIGHPSTIQVRCSWAHWSLVHNIAEWEELKDWSNLKWSR